MSILSHAPKIKPFTASLRVSVQKVWEHTPLLFSRIISLLYRKKSEGYLVRVHLITLSASFMVATTPLAALPKHWWYTSVPCLTCSLYPNYHRLTGTCGIYVPQINSGVFCTLSTKVTPLLKYVYWPTIMGGRKCSIWASCSYRKNCLDEGLSTQQSFPWPAQLPLPHPEHRLPVRRMLSSQEHQHAKRTLQDPLQVIMLFPMNQPARTTPLFFPEDRLLAKTIFPVTGFLVQVSRTPHSLPRRLEHCVLSTNLHIIYATLITYYSWKSWWRTNGVERVLSIHISSS